jgi:ABC-2 type transport system ATP-binding protein
MNVIEIDNLTKYYSTIPAIENVSISISKGTVFGLIGPNGAGKTTLIRLLIGLTRPSSGSSFILGKNTATEFSSLTRNVSAVVETPSFFPGLTAVQTLRTLSDYSGEKSCERRLCELLELVGLLDARNKKVERFSLGMKQRLAVAGALLSRPEVLILDEPTNGLDPTGVMELRSLLLNASSAGTTVFVSSHMLSELERTCSQVAFIVEGRVKRSGMVTDLLSTSMRMKADPAEKALRILRARLPAFANEICMDGDEIRLPSDFHLSPEVLDNFAANAITVYEIVNKRLGLEEIFQECVNKV